MLIHDHSERVGAPTVQASGTSASVAIASRPEFMQTVALGDLAIFGIGWLLLGILIGWSINAARVRWLTKQRAVLCRRLARAAERHDHAKQVIAHMVDEEAKARRAAAVA